MSLKLKACRYTTAYPQSQPSHSQKQQKQHPQPAFTAVVPVGVFLSDKLFQPSSRVLDRPIEREVGDFLPSIDGGQQMRAIELHDLRHRLGLVVLRIRVPHLRGNRWSCFPEMNSNGGRASLW